MAAQRALRASRGLAGKQDPGRAARVSQGVILGAHGEGQRSGCQLREHPSGRPPAPPYLFALARPRGACGDGPAPVPAVGSGGEVLWHWESGKDLG